MFRTTRKRLAIDISIKMEDSLTMHDSDSVRGRTINNVRKYECLYGIKVHCGCIRAMLTETVRNGKHVGSVSEERLSHSRVRTASNDELIPWCGHATGDIGS